MLLVRVRTTLRQRPTLLPELRECKRVSVVKLKFDCGREDEPFSCQQDLNPIELVPSILLHGNQVFGSLNC